MFPYVPNDPHYENARSCHLYPFDSQGICSSIIREVFLPPPWEVFLEGGMGTGVEEGERGTKKNSRFYEFGGVEGETTEIGGWGWKNDATRGYEGILRDNFKGFSYFVSQNSPNFFARAFGARTFVSLVRWEAHTKTRL